MTEVILNENWEFADADAQLWRTIAVPGDINDALLKHDVLPDPHFGVQFEEYYPNSGKTWLYRCKFDSIMTFHNNAELIFESLTGVTEIRLNGNILGVARNAHRPHHFEVGKLLKTQDNYLELCFESIEKSIGKKRRDKYGWGNERTLLRTSQFNFGWDWSVPVPAIGISGTVRLVYDNQFRFINVNYRTPKLGRTDFFFEVSRNTRELGYSIQIRLCGHNVNIQRTLTGDLKAPLGSVEEANVYSQHRIFTTLQVPEAKTWWPNGYGEAALYDWEADLIVCGKIVDKARGKLGFRTVDIIENPFREISGTGFSYEFCINGKSIFVKGANWIPVELWPTIGTDQKYYELLKLAQDAGFNMLRVWGGGIYERELFYQLCDEFGIMVWQDFMFASNAYPVGLLREEIKLEAEYQLKRLRIHPCIVQWCGINEDIFSWAYPGCGRQKNMIQADIGDYSGSGEWQLHDDPEIFSMILRGLTGLLGNNTPYIESSPASHGDCGNMPQSGNCHQSCAKHLRMNPTGNFREHFAQVCSFNSEFGIQGPDSAYATRKMIGEENCVTWPPTNQELWTRHFQRGQGSALWVQQAAIAEKLIGPIDSFETFIKYAQTAHLELVRCEYEYSRCDRPDCGGTMVWMYNDCWPTGNWAIVNYECRPKPAYFAAKRACASFLPIVVSRCGRVEFAFDNGTPLPVHISYTLGLTGLDNIVRWNESGSAMIPGNVNHRLAVRQLAADFKQPGDHYFLNVEGLPTVRCFTDGWKNIPWPKANPSLAVIRPGMLLVKAGDSYVRMAHIVSRNPKQKLSLSDNYFDLGAGESHEVTITPEIVLDDLKLLHWKTNWE